ncbi:MAG: protein of unknown function with transmembrane region [Candidatus Campbellbacteria bacterium GW2011_OD1_34_28]|nr:MAG: protein of unknown function with transmembrane region [Candidatus Campbellbacteria bacterium GW2011_OD1_34_28]
MIFDKKNKKIIKIFWMVLGALLIVSMILLYTPLFF